MTTETRRVQIKKNVVESREKKIRKKKKKEKKFMVYFRRKFFYPLGWEKNTRTKGKLFY